MDVRWTGLPFEEAYHLRWAERKKFDALGNAREEQDSRQDGHASRPIASTGRAYSPEATLQIRQRHPFP